MTTLSLAVRNYLAQDPELTALLGKSASWPTWIFDEKPVMVRIENTSRCMIVVNEDDPWTSPNDHNTLRFPRLLVDIWADPTRNPDRSVAVEDAKTKIVDIQGVVDKHLHMMDLATPAGLPWVWGDEDEVQNRTGVVVVGSKRVSGPSFSPVRDSEGSWMGRLVYGVVVP